MTTQSQVGASISANTVFLACNFNNKRVKRHFDGLKQEWESTLPVRVYLSDRVQGAGARDLWKEITQTITEANLAIFDITSFRPNVVLELGYALPLKDAKQIVICRDLTPSGRTGAKPEKWELSDITHLFRFEYKTFAHLDAELLQHVEAMLPVRRFYSLVGAVERQSKLSKKLYIAEALGVLKELRDSGPIRRKEFTSRLTARNVEATTLGNLLKRFELAKPSRDGLWKLID
jgi:hypothetical protein